MYNVSGILLNGTKSMYVSSLGCVRGEEHDSKFLKN